MIDLANDTPRLKVKFINNLSEIKGSQHDQWTADAPSKKQKKMNFKGVEAFQEQMKEAQAANKREYKKLADAAVKSEQYTRVLEALKLDKNLKGKGKKRKITDEETGRVSYKWFSERKK